MMIPVSDPGFRNQVEEVKALVLNEVNVKEIEFIHDTAGILVKRIKPNYKSLGPRFGKLMKELSTAIDAMEQEEILDFEKNGTHQVRLNGEIVTLTLEDVEIVSEDIPGWLVANEGAITVALDVNITEALRQEGVARELINRIQNIRKESGFDVTDRIHVIMEKHEVINDAVVTHTKYIGSQTLADNIELTDKLDNNHSKRIDIDEDVYINIRVTRV
jgi:isoleucyl-tRNA synthetase